MTRPLILVLLLLAAPAWADTIPFTRLALDVHHTDSVDRDGTAGVDAPGISGAFVNGPTFRSTIDGSAAPFFTGLSGGYDHGNATVNGVNYEIPRLSEVGLGASLSWTSPGIFLDPLAASGTVTHETFPVHIGVLVTGDFGRLDLVGDFLATFTLTAHRCGETECPPTSYHWAQDSLTPVVQSPEPATWLLLLTGLGGLGLHLWARKGRHAGQIVGRG